MNLLDSLLDAIIRLDGDALVMHAGEKPYVVTTSEATNDFRGPLIWGQVELSSRALTAEALAGMLAQFMPAEQRAALHECGATVFEVTASTEGAERFSIIAARGGEDVWLEIRRLAKVRTTAPAVAAASATDAAAQVAELEAPDVPAVVEAGPPVEAVLPAVAVSPEWAAGESLSPVDGLEEEPAAGELAVEEFAAEEFVAEQFTPEAFAAGDPAEPAFEPVSASPAEADPEPALEILQDDPLDLPMAEEAPAMHDETLDHVAGVLVSEQAWGDDVMTEGDLGELLRASAAAMIADEAGGGGSFYQSAPAVGLLSPDEHAGAPMSFDGALDEEIDLTGGFQTGTEFFMESALTDQAPEPAFAEPGVAHGEAEPEPEPALTLSAEEALRAAREAFQAAQALVPLEEPAEPQAEPMAPADLLPAERAAIEPEIQPAAPEPSDMSDESRFEQSPEQAQDAAPDTMPAAAPAEPEQPASPRPGAVVLPLTRAGRPDGAGDGRGAAAGTLQRILQSAATRGASTVYVVVGSPPMVRVDGEFSALEGEPALNASFVERLVAELTPQTRDTTPAELIAEIPEVGRVRCVPFRDHRGPGIIFRMVPARAIAADQLGLASELQALSTEADGLVLVAGGPGSGRSTLLTSFVDLINRTRSDFVIALESQIGFFHENKRSFISQREVRGGAEGMAAALRSAMREDPDVLVVEDLRTPELIALALEAAHAGKLVFASIPAATAAGAVERVLEAFPPDRREKALATLAGTLRGVMAQVLLRRLKGGRVAAREVLINTPAVASLILDGRTPQLHTALESGQRYGMMTFAESLAGLVREGVVHPSHAFRKAPDREQFLAAIKRDGVDATIAERLA